MSKKILQKITYIFVLSTLLKVALPLAVQPALAFKPNEGGHLGITSTAVNSTQRVVNDETLKFSERALKQIRDANKDTDSLSGQADASLHVDDEAFTATTNRLVGLKQSIIAKITSSSPDGASARKDLGGALHTLQDFYAHTNWVELGNTVIDTRLGRSTFSGLPITTATSPANNPGTLLPGLRELTSGWFKIPLCIPPTGKTRHGISIPFSPDPCPSGLNKDEPDRPGYAAARNLAIEASKDFLNQILDDSRVAGNAKAIKALMDIKGTLGVIIDDTGSMGGIINQVKTQVAQITNTVRGTDNEPSQYLLVRFGDPDVGNAFVTGDADAFVGAVNALSAGGGGDCPELSMTGLLRAVAASQSDSNLYLFTDASSKDASVVGNVIAIAKAKQIKINPLLFGSCSPIDPAYVKVAEETGGQLFFLRTSEAGSTFNLIKPQLSGNLVPIVSVRSTLSGGSRTLDVPIDSSVESATFSVSIDSKGPIALFRPSGAEVVSGNPGVTITELSSGRIVTVNAPETGTWRLQIQGSGDFSAEAQANSSIQFNSFQFVKLTGRPDHEGLFPIAGQPTTTTDNTGLASVFGPFNTVNFKLVSESGETIQSVNLVRGNSQAAADEFVGNFGLPATPFRVAVSGVDSKGLPYQRLFATSFRRQTVEVTADSPIASLPIGATTTLRFIVRNTGTAGNFQLVFADNLRFITRVQPTVLNLASGASGTVDVDVTVPTSTPIGTNISLTATAISTTDSSINNSTTLNLAAADPNKPPTCPAPGSIQKVLWPPNGKFVAIDVISETKVIDPDGDPVTVVVNAITQDEPVNTSGDGNTVPDGAGVGTNVAQVRAERNGQGNGRVYQIIFTATDNKGAECRGNFSVTVPKSQNGNPSVDDGQNFDSTKS
ncbi:hypothetical protein [Nostoc sp. LEGE 12450]|uniref:hypothetical protein n=1 Tax=Nostoc sp. LEGE 12450 TaxID=1828643 RepID=UPI001881643A|nr:hypothetical protein [Nostoc sp. LEGE 12450]MBE8988348.1 hypothetical protein [Nostoc sp. LEGE 12450]